MTGVGGFNGDRLREAREARGLSAVQVAELLGVTKQAVHLYERAKCSPAPETFKQICTVLRFPPRFFQGPSRPKLMNPIFYRSMASATRRMRDRAERRFEWFRELTKVIAKYVDMPAISLPDLSPPSDPGKLTDIQVEQAAATVRRHWGLGDGVITNVAMLLESKGIPITAFEFEADDLDGFSTWDDYTGRPFIVLATDKTSASRDRFSAAHELGHLVLHRNVPGDLLKLASSFRRIEDQAHLFARNFLLPRATFAREYIAPTLTALKELKRKWRVSIGTLIMRAAEVGAISGEQAKKLWINRTRQGWHRAEPFDDEWQPERPVLLSRSVDLVVGAQRVSKGDLLHAMALYPNDIEPLAGLAPGYLGGATDEPTTDESATEPEPKLLPFRRGQAN